MTRRLPHILAALWLASATPILAETNLDLALSFESECLVAEARLSLDNERELLSVVRDGATFTIEFEMNLSRRDDQAILIFGGAEAVISKFKIEREIAYDPVKRKYTVREGERIFIFSSSSSLLGYILRARREMTCELDDEAIYVVKSKSTGKSIKLNFPFNLLLDIIGTYQFTTDWRGKEVQIQ